MDQTVGPRMGAKVGSGYGAIRLDRMTLRRKFAEEISHDRRHHRFVQRHPVVGKRAQRLDHELRVAQELSHRVRIFSQSPWSATQQGSTQ